LITSASTISPDGYIYFSSYTNIYCLDEEGTLKWKSPGVYRGGSALNGPAIADDGTIYVTWTGFRNMQDEQRGYIIAYNNEDGAVEWQAPLKYEADSPSVGENADVYVMADDIYNNDSRIHVFDQNGISKNSIYLGHGTLSVPVIDLNGNIIISDSWSVIAGTSWYQPVYEPYSQIISFDQNGTELWRSGEQASSSIDEQIIIDNQETIIVKKTIYERYSIDVWSGWWFKAVKEILTGIDANNGSEKWQIDLPGNMISSFTLSDNGGLYFVVKEQVEGGIKINLYFFGPNGETLKAKEKIEVSDDSGLNEELNLMLNEFDFDLEPEIKEEFEVEGDLFDEDFDLEGGAEIINNEQSVLEAEEQDIIEPAEKKQEKRSEIVSEENVIELSPKSADIQPETIDIEPAPENIPPGNAEFTPVLEDELSE